SRIQREDSTRLCLRRPWPHHKLHLGARRQFCKAGPSAHRMSLSAGLSSLFGFRWTCSSPPRNLHKEGRNSLIRSLRNEDLSQNNQSNLWPKCTTNEGRKIKADPAGSI